MSIFDEYTGDIRQNLRQRMEIIIESIAETYENGNIDDAQSNHCMMSLFALACEDKLEGVIAEGGVKWTLTEDYANKLEEELSSYPPEETSKVVKGPW